MHGYNRHSRAASRDDPCTLTAIKILPKSMNPDQWNAFAGNRTVQQRIINDPVLPVYPSLLAQFAQWRTVTWDDAVVALHIVYGWMPTIPNLALPAGLQLAGKTRVESLLNQARTPNPLSANDLQFLMQNFANKSMIGLSKLLHFLAPDRYAIWDSRVAKVWFSPRQVYPYFYNTPTVYLNYLAALSGWANIPQTATLRSSVRNLSPHLAMVCDLRLLELVLFHA